MANSKVIGMRVVRAAGREIPVVLSANANGTVSGQCLLGESERPILDGGCVADVLALIADSAELLVMSRRVLR